MSSLVHVQRTKQVKCGLEVPSGLVYQGWEPGGEYTKSFILKNVNLKTQKVKYKISSNQFSSAVYPQPIVLSAGTSYTLPITFRPNEKCPYEEHIQIQTAEGEFRIPIKAQLPKTNISLPDTLKFGMAAVEDCITISFDLSNTGNVDVSWSWEVPAGFTVKPDSGDLSVKQATKLRASFSPVLARVYSVEAVCRFKRSDGTGSAAGENQTIEPGQFEGTKIVRLEGIGKYPHVTVQLTSGESKLPSTKRKGTKVKTVKKTSDTPNAPPCDMMRETCVDFGPVPVGTVAEKWIKVTNVSPVATKFEVTPNSPSSDFIPHFTSSDFEGFLQPQESKKLKMLYSPQYMTGHKSYSYFTVRAAGGLGRCTIVCKGTPVAPCVKMDKDVVNFGNVELGKSVNKIIKLRNESKTGTVYQFGLDCDSSVFQCTPISGELGPDSTKQITLTFSPLKALPYCRHIALTVKHQEPLTLSLIGTCYSETTRPATVQAHHLTAYLDHAKTGLSKLPPERLKLCLDEGSLSVGDNETLTIRAGLDLPSPGEPLTNYQSKYSHYLESQHEPSNFPHVSVDTKVLSFGHCSAHNTSEPQMLTVTNHTEGTLTCVWMTSETDCFSVSPAQRPIQPGTTVCFTATFNPDTQSQFYSKELECFVYYEGLQDYRQIEPLTITPPWCLTVQATGHTFTGSDTFQPRLNIDNKNVVFPSSVPGEPVYSTVLLTNEGDTPVLYNITQEQSDVFSVKPAHGLIKDSQLLVLQFIPSETKVYKHVISCQLNATQLSNEDILVSGSGEAPVIKLDNEGELFFKPTCVGTSSCVDYGVTNSSRLPIRFKWRLEDIDSSVVSVGPREGTLLSQETQRHSWVFTPNSCKHYSLKTVLSTQTMAQQRATRFRNITAVSIHGLGVQGTLSCSPGSVDCGTVVIGTSSQHKLMLSNPSACSLQYSLSVEHTSSPLSAGTKQSVLELVPSEGVLAARTQVPIRVTVRPVTTEEYLCSIKYQLVGSTSHAKGGLSCNGELCTVSVCGAYPSLEITGIQGAGTANTHSKAQLWTMLNIDKVNVSLCDEPSAAELRYAIATRHSMRRRVPVRTRAIVDCDFGASPLDSESSSVHIMLSNKGKVSTEWAFQFPCDMHLEPEYWAETGQLDDVEKHELNILENELFTVQPKRGTLLPSQSSTIVASFKHSHVGTSKLPVLFKINRGREILMNWTGVTVQPGQAHIHFSTTSHTFKPVPIGLQAYPRQVYTFHNVGQTSVNYEIDTKPLEALKLANYGMSVIECLQPRGVLEPASTLPVEFVFSPLETKRYTVDVPVHLSTGEAVLLSFTGEGLDHTDTSNNQPLSNPPAQGLISIPGQKAKLSQQAIDFGHLPLFSAVRRLVFVSNLSTHTLSFNWDLGSALASEVICVQPVTGFIQPGESAACKITFRSQTSPSFHNLDLVCQVMDESEMMRYDSQLRDWERQEEEKQHLFVISDKNKPNKRPKSMPKLKSLSNGRGKKTTPRQEVPRPLSSDTELRSKLTALPPIGSSEPASYDQWKLLDLSVKSKTRPRVKKSSEKEVPVPPNPLLLHLGVTAQTSAVPDYASLSDDLDSYYIDQHSLITSSGSCDFRNESCGKVGIEEKQTVENILLQITRELLDDSNFHTAIKNVTEEPVPYFRQFSTQPEIPIAQPSTRQLTQADLVAQPSQTDQVSLSVMEDSDQAVIEHGLGLEDSLEHTTTTKSLRTLDSTSLDSQIKRLPEFTGLVEGILENTLLNILREASCGEVNLVAPVYSIAKPPSNIVI